MSDDHPQHVIRYMTDDRVDLDQCWIIGDERLPAAAEAELVAAWKAHHAERMRTGQPTGMLWSRRRPSDRPRNEAAYTQALQAYLATRGARVQDTAVA